MPTVNPSTRAITDITVNVICSVANESTWNAPSSANQQLGVRRLATPIGARNAHPATSHSTARVSMASASIDRDGPLESPCPLPTPDSVPGVRPSPESYATTSDSWSASTTSVTSVGTPHLASAARCSRRTTDWKNPPLSQYPLYHDFLSATASSLISPSTSAVCVALPPGRNPVLAAGCAARCAASYAGVHPFMKSLRECGCR
mmetsp:Transcript_1491/g.4249  ORF Transcript_1491/g.4249 Transcript_1491/m.4249 type:complete len:204 (-) Transcript_1491:240-851(-)